MYPKLYSNSFCIGLLSHCNWSCDYCIARNNNLPLDENEILSQVREMKDVLGTVFLSGGEPGLLSEDFWDELFNMTHHQLAICTNGTFVKHGFYAKYRERIREIIIHCVQEIDEPIMSYIEELIKTDEKVKGNIVVHRHNTKHLRNFLLAYPDIDFQLFFADDSFEVFHQDDKVYRYALNRESAVEVLTALRGLGRYSIYANKVMRAIIKDDFSTVNSWSHLNKDFTKT